MVLLLAGQSGHNNDDQHDQDDAYDDHCSPVPHQGEEEQVQVVWYYC